MTTAWKGWSVVLLLALGPTAWTVAGQAKPSTDEGVKARVEARLFDEGLVGAHADVRQGTVTLSGAVASLWLKDEAARQTRKVRGVKDVVNALTVRPRAGDAAMAREIADELSASPSFTVFDDLSIRVANGVATLTGAVTTLDKSREFTKAASRVPGVQQIVNQIETLPALMSDDDLRYAIANAIYSNPIFSMYASQRVGPVHIIVRRGHVTLIGVVGSEIERRMAEMLAREAFGVMGVANELRIEKEDG